MEAIRFSPDTVFLVSVGDSSDKGLFVWRWQDEKKVASNKLSKVVNLVEFSEKQDFFVTAGYQHLKFWYFDEQEKTPIVKASGSSNIMESAYADLGDVKGKIFVGLAVYNDTVYTLTSVGHIYVFSKQRTMTQWMNIKVKRAFGCSVSDGKLYCACCDGTLRVFLTDSLKHILTFPRPPPLGDTNQMLG